MPGGCRPAPESSFPVPNWTHRRPESTLPVPESRRSGPESTLPVPESTLPVPDECRPAAQSRLPAAESTFPVPDGCRTGAVFARFCPSGTHDAGTMSDSFYPDGQGNQIDWNTNIIAHAGLLPDLGFTAAQVTSITNDCQMTIYLLSNVGQMADSTYASLHGFAKSMEKSALGTAAAAWPTLPTWPATPPAMVAPGIGARRSAWVVTAKRSPAYNPDTNGRTLRLEISGTPFNPATYVAELKSVDATGHETVLVKIGKGGGQVTAAQLQMKRGTGHRVQDRGHVHGALVRRSHPARPARRAGVAPVPASRHAERCRHRPAESHPDRGRQLGTSTAGGRTTPGRGRGFLPSALLP